MWRYYPHLKAAEGCRTPKRWRAARRASNVAKRLRLSSGAFGRQSERRNPVESVGGPPPSKTWRSFENVDPDARCMKLKTALASCPPNRFVFRSLSEPDETGASNPPDGLESVLGGILFDVQG